MPPACDEAAPRKDCGGAHTSLAASADVPPSTVAGWHPRAIVRYLAWESGVMRQPRSRGFHHLGSAWSRRIQWFGFSASAGTIRDAAGTTPSSLTGRFAWRSQSFSTAAAPVQPAIAASDRLHRERRCGGGAAQHQGTRACTRLRARQTVVDRQRAADDARPRRHAARRARRRARPSRSQPGCRTSSQLRRPRDRRSRTSGECSGRGLRRSARPCA